MLLLALLCKIFAGGHIVTALAACHELEHGLPECRRPCNFLRAWLPSEQGSVLGLDTF